MKVRIIDLETQCHPWYGQVASPHNPENYVVMAGWCDDIFGGTPGPVQHLHFTSLEDERSCNWFNLDGVDLIVAHNAGYEVSWFLTRYRDEFEKFLKRGGRVLCTQMAEYILSDFTNTYPSLDETAPKYGGTHKIDAVKELWKQGYLTSQIDPKLLAEYLAGPEGDVENTRRTFYGQMALLQERGQWGLFLERCEALLAFAYCEFFGLYVNTEVAEANLKKQEAELAELRAEVQKLLPELPEHFEFNWGSDYHLSALLFGGPVKYKTRVPRTDAGGLVMYEKQDCYKFGETYAPVGYFIDESQFSQWVQDHGNVDRYKAGKNKGQPKVHKVETDVPQMKWDDAVFVFPGVIWIQQLPSNIQEKFEYHGKDSRKNGDWTGARLLCDDKTPVYSTSSEVLEVLAKHGFEAADKLSRMASLEKDNSTYYYVAEYAKEKPKGKSRTGPVVEPAEPRKGTIQQPYTHLETPVRADQGGLGGDAGTVQLPLSDMRSGDVGRQDSTAVGQGSPGPLPRDGEDSGRAVPSLQQGPGDGRGQLAGRHAIRNLPKVGVDGCTKVRGMLQYVQPDGIIHHSLNLCATATGRLSSSNPNLQNLPRDGTSRVKEMFESRFGKAGRIIEVDYSALEVVMLAALSGDENLLEQLIKGTDMHCLRLAAKLGEPYEEVLHKAVQNQNHPEHKRYKQMRTDIKAPSFAKQVAK